MPTLKEEAVFVREVHVYAWTCKVCGEDVEVRTRALKVFLSCPMCSVLVRRHGVLGDAWRIKAERDERTDQEEARLAVSGIEEEAA